MARLSRCFIGEREVCAFAGQAPLQGKESLGRAMARSATEDDVLPRAVAERPEVAAIAKVLEDP